MAVEILGLEILLCIPVSRATNKMSILPHMSHHLSSMTKLYLNFIIKRHENQELKYFDALILPVSGSLFIKDKDCLQRSVKIMILTKIAAIQSFLA